MPDAYIETGYQRSAMFRRPFAGDFTSPATATASKSSNQISFVDDLDRAALTLATPKVASRISVANLNAFRKGQDGPLIKYFAGEISGRMLSSHDVPPIRYRLGAAGDCNHQRSRSLYNNSEKLKTRKEGQMS
jgi:hypothetical protein